MFPPTSRYAGLDTAFIVDRSGRQIPYRRRRLLASGDTMPEIGRVRVIAGDRLDLVTARALGDPEQFWQLCDANDAMNPFDLITAPGQSLRVGMPRNPA